MSHGHADALERFKHVTKTWAIVGPGLTTPSHGMTDEFDTDSGDYREFHGLFDSSRTR